MIRFNVFTAMRFVRNFLISIISAIWILPLYLSLMSLLLLLKTREPEILGIEPEMISFSYINLSQHLLVAWAVLFSAAIFFWTFIAANRLWPINRK